MTSPDNSGSQTTKDRSMRSKFLLIAAAAIGPGIAVGFSLADLWLSPDTPVEQTETGTLGHSFRGE